MPTPGQLLALVPRPMSGPAALPWRPASAEIYADMTLWEKIREKTNLALEARMAAGPMWVGGRPLTPDKLPPRWHRFTRIAHEHEADLRELRQIAVNAK
jgi:hypothetical protein